MNKPYDPFCHHFCDICGTRFVRRDHLKRHLLRCTRHSETRFVCDLCGVSTARRDGLLRHMNTVHDGRPACPPSPKFDFVSPQAQDRYSVPQQSPQEYDLHKEWKELRDRCNKTRKKGTDFMYKGHDIQNELEILLLIYQKEKKQKQSFSTPSQEMASQSNIPHVEMWVATEVNNKVKKENVKSENNYDTVYSNSQPEETEPAIPVPSTNPKGLFESTNIDKKNILDNDFRLFSNSSLTSQQVTSHEDEYISDTKPHCSNTSRPIERSYQEVRRGIKRPREGNENIDDEQCVKKLVELYTKDFNYSQNTHLCSELLPLLESHLSMPSNFNNDEIRDFNFSAISVILSFTKNLDAEERSVTILKILDFIDNADNVK